MNRHRRKPTKAEWQWAMHFIRTELSRKWRWPIEARELGFTEGVWFYHRMRKLESLCYRIIHNEFCDNEARLKRLTTGNAPKRWVFRLY